MSRFQRHVIALYRRLLRLYPSRFRAEFADEMSIVFGEAVEDSRDALSLVDLLAGELWDLPINLLREHLHERRAKAFITIIEEKIMVETVVPMRAFRGLTWTLLIVFTLYCLLILLPYFYNGLNQVSWEMLTSGLYDPKGYPPFVYEGVVGAGLELLGVLVVILGLPTIAAMGGVLGLTLRRHWHQLQQKQRILGSAAVVIAVFMLGIVVSPFGRTLIIWFMD
jgi:hypothetical protein